MIDIKIINGIVLEFRSPKNMGFVRDVCKPLGGRWHSRNGCWTFDVSVESELIHKAREAFPDARVTLTEIEKPVLDRKSDNKRKIIAGALLLKAFESSQPGNELHDWFAEKIELMAPKDKVYFGHKTQVKRWSMGSDEPKVTTTEIA